MEIVVQDFASEIESYGRSGDRRLLGLVGMVSSMAVAIGLYAAVGLVQPSARDAQQARFSGSMAASIESADGPGGAASLAIPGATAAFHGRG